jgi:hypothetical protein
MLTAHVTQFEYIRVTTGFSEARKQLMKPKINVKIIV